MSNIGEPVFVERQGSRDLRRTWKNQWLWMRPMRTAPGHRAVSHDRERQNHDDYQLAGFSHRSCPLARVLARSRDLPLRAAGGSPVERIMLLSVVPMLQLCESFPDINVSHILTFPIGIAGTVCPILSSAHRSGRS